MRRTRPALPSTGSEEDVLVSDLIACNDSGRPSTLDEEKLEVHERPKVKGRGTYSLLRLFSVHDTQ